jgi:UDP-N-acetylglucosamine 2-epimerase
MRHPRKGIEEVLIHTGQHYDYLMDRVFFEELQMRRCDYHLGVGSGTHGKQTGMMLDRVEPILQKERPDVVLVYGDTNSTLAGALVAAKMLIPVVHVEAGLRSYDRKMPEEVNRVLTDHVSTVLFCPTEESVRNLATEGISNGKDGRWVENVGDVMHDSILYYSNLADRQSTILEDLELVSRSNSFAPNPELRTPNYSSSAIPQYYLATLHRAENTDDPRKLKSILKALDEIADSSPVILPLHPRTKRMMETHGLRLKSSHVKLIEPVSYLNMLKLERNAKVILTDSGGVQKEAYWLEVPCVTLREVTEWGYTVEEGWNTVTGWKTEKIVRAVQRIMNQKRKRRVGNRKKPTASEKIVRLLLKHF